MLSTLQPKGQQSIGQCFIRTPIVQRVSKVLEHLAFETDGNPRKPSVMLLHGFLSCNAQWLLNRRALAEHYHLVMIELWGHGNSPAPQAVDRYTISEYITEFERIRNLLDIERWSLIGQSYGAGLVLNYATAHPARCSNIVVTNSRSAFGNISNDGSAQSNSMRNDRFDRRLLPIHPIHARRFPSAVKDALVANADAIPRHAIQLGGRLAVQLNSVALLEHINRPMLLVNGVYEKSFQRDVDRLTKLGHPTLKIVDLPGGHSINVEAAAQFDEAVVASLAHA